MSLMYGRFVCILAVLLCFLFCGCAFAEALTLPLALREIRDKAFAEDVSLDEVVLPKHLERIGAAAFRGSSVRRIYLPASLSYIAPDAFAECDGVVGYGPEGTYASRFFLETEGLRFEKEESSRRINIHIGSKTYAAELADSETGRAFAALLPLTINMSELNGNEKYYYLNDTLPSSPESVGQIRAGDLMLYGNNCVVLFYKSFSTQYSYTRIGHIDDVTGLQKAVSSGSVQVEFTGENESK